MTTIPDDNGATAALGAAGRSAPPHQDPDLQAQVWAILNAAVERGEEPPSARAIRLMVRRNNSQVLRLVTAWQEERRTRPLAPSAVTTPVVPIPPASTHAPVEDAFTGIPQTVAAMLHSANEALSAAAHALVQMAQAFREALTEAGTQAERRLGEALAATSAAAEAVLAAERERFAAERTLLQDAADARMAEAARFAGDAADMMEELEAKETDTLERMAALESQIAAAGAEAAAHQRRIDELQGELVDTRHQRDTARLEVAALTGRLEASDRMRADLEARFNSWESDRRQEVERLRAENDQRRNDLAEAHRQIAALAAHQAGAAGSLSALVERLLAATPTASGTRDASRDANGPAAGCAAERDGGAPAPARPKSRPARRRRDTASGKQDTRLPFGLDFGVAIPSAVGAAGAVADPVEPTVAADGMAALTDS